MGDSDIQKSIRKTQELLGKHVKKPPLSEKNLARPPFRFLHDIVTTVINTTGFLNGVFSAEELESSNVATREAKSEFMQKLITAINESGEEISVKVSKILAGQEPEKTNELLQALARAIEKSGNASKASKVAAATTKTKGKDQKLTNSNTKVTNPVSKSVRKADTPATKKEGTGTGKTTNTSVKPKVDGKGKKDARDPSPATTNNEINKSSRTGKTVVSLDQKTSLPPPSVDRAQDEIPVDNEIAEVINMEPQQQISQDESLTTKQRKAQASASRGSALKRQNSSIKNSGLEGPLDETPERGSSSLKREFISKDGRKASTDPTEIIADEHEVQHVARNDFTNSSMKPNMETLSLPASVIVPDASLMGLGLSESPESVLDNSGDLSGFKSPLDSKTGMTNSPGPSGIGLVNEKVEARGDAFGGISSTIENMQSRNRPGTGNNRLISARPPSARPAPPRPRSSMFKDAEESNFRPPTGKVSNVLLDSTETNDDDDNFVIREAAVSKGIGLSDLDETPELALTAGAKPEEQMDDILLPGQRGLLVNQILETQKELEDKESEKMEGKQDFSIDRSKSREVTTAEIEKLKTLIQDCARNANPLGKLLDYVREDMDAMQKELLKWREESRYLDTELEKAKLTTEASLQPLQQQLTEMDTRIADKEDAIAATKMSIVRHQQRIEKILSGLDRVQSSHGKISISASQLLQNETFTPTIEESDVHENSFSTGFGIALNRISKSSVGMRPVNMLSTDDLDPDNFDPWKS